MTMLREKKNSIWTNVREDRDIDDLIFETEKAVYKQPVTTSDR